MRWLDRITNSIKMNLSKLQEIGKEREAWRAAVHGITKSRAKLNDWTTTNCFTVEKKENHAICDNMDGPRGHYAKWDKSDRERQILYGITYMWKLKNPYSQKQRVDWWLLGTGRWGKWAELVKGTDFQFYDEYIGEGWGWKGDSRGREGIYVYLWLIHVVVWQNHT